MDLFLEYLRAFLCGGLLCLIGQILIDRTTLTPAKILVIYVVSGVVLGGLGIYKYIVQWGGAGATVPLTGFGYLLAKGVAQAVEEGGPAGRLYRRCNRRRRRYLRRDFLRLSGGAYFQAQTQRVIGTIPRFTNRRRGTIMPRRNT